MIIGSVKTALGKIYYDDDEGNEHTAYGLIAQTIIGQLIMSENLQIKNESSTIELNEDGIIIKNSDETVVFQAKPDGDVSILGKIQATSGYIGDEDEGFLIEKNYIYHNIGNTETRVLIGSGTDTNEYDVCGQTLSNLMLLAGENFAVTSNGDLYAYSGYIGDLKILNPLQLDEEGSAIGLSGLKSPYFRLIGGTNASDLNSYGLYLGDFGSDSSITDNITTEATYYAKSGMYCPKGEITDFNAINIVANEIVTVGLEADYITIGDSFTIDTSSGTSKQTFYLDFSGSGSTVTIKIYSDSAHTKSANLIQSKTWSVYLVARWDGKGYWYTITIPKGSSSGSYSTGWFWGISSATLYGSPTFYQYEYTSGSMQVDTNILPKTDMTYTLGSTDHTWEDVYVKNASIVYSDKNLKKDIGTLTDEYGNLFDNLVPVSFKFVQNDSNRTHIGLLAQDVKDAIEVSGLTTTDFAGYCEWEKDDGKTGCGLRYGEFIALCISEIQKLKSRVTELENREE